MIKILTVIGARPQFVKAAVVSRALKSNDYFQEILVHTGQHFDQNMSDIFFKEMEIPKPDFHLNINSMNHGAMTGKMMESLENLMLDKKPDIILVYGDTNSTLAGALAAAKLHIPLAHVEAGLRSFNMRMPEEVNRILSDRVSNILYCPTMIAKNNLLNEGYESFNNRMVVVGDVMYDAALYYSQKSDNLSHIIDELSLDKFILCTLHRAENTDDPSKLKGICEALNLINEKFKIVLPLHPRTKEVLRKNQLKLSFETIDPVGYFDMISLLKHSELVITDSGGLQKEAYFFSKPCVTLREQTEWIELIENKVNILVGSDCENIVSSVEMMIDSDQNFSEKLYGNGNAAELINEDLSNYLNLTI